MHQLSTRFEVVYRWECGEGKQSLAVAVNGPLNVDDGEILVRAAIDGVSLDVHVGGSHETSSKPR
jgi:hypothetical protein